MFSKKAVLLLVVVALLSMIAAGCGTAQPQTITVVETVVVEKEVQGETVTVVETVEVVKEVEKVVTQEVEVVKEVAVDPDALPPEETLFYGDDSASGSGDIPTLDPSLLVDSKSIQWARELFVGPTRLNEENNEVEPGMATEWEVSDDGLVYTFKLRDDVPWVKYNNATGEVEQVLDDEGNPRIVNANDFVYGIRRTLDPATASDYSYVNWLIVNAQEVNGGAEDGEENPLYGKLEEIGVRAVDDFTLEYTLKEPAAFFPAIAEMWINYAQPQWLIEEKGDRWIESGVIQTYGPYALREWVHDVSVTLIANPFWPGSDSIPKPSIKYVHAEFLEESPQFANYEAGLVDVVSAPVTELDRIKADPTLSEELNIAPSQCTYYYGFNVTKPPFDDVNVRKAFSYAVDRTLLVENVTKGGQEPARWFSRPGLLAGPDPAAGDDFGPPVTADPEKAKEFLAASTQYPTAGDLPEINLAMNQTEAHVKIGEAIQQMWKENLGVEVNLVIQEWKVYLETLDEDPPQIWRLGWCSDYPDASNFLKDVFRSDSGNNHTKWGNEEFDRIVDEAARETDLAKRKELYLQAEKILIEDEAVIIPLYWYTEVNLTKPYVTRTYGTGGQESFEKWSLSK
ncbi:MAG: peptide ABC transporter substrate-binding protein [Anaerolineae bacterium]|nr:peptide ABC transporter substrate-binding protein [Anaerolineae bacterium]